MVPSEDKVVFTLLHPDYVVDCLFLLLFTPLLQTSHVMISLLLRRLLVGQQSGMLFLELVNPVLGVFQGGLEVLVVSGEGGTLLFQVLVSLAEGLVLLFQGVQFYLQGGLLLF